MECPNCHSTMTYDRKDTSSAGNVRYDRESYKCSHDGTWVTVETPQQEEKE